MRTHQHGGVVLVVGVVWVLLIPRLRRDIKSAERANTVAEFSAPAGDGTINEPQTVSSRGYGRSAVTLRNFGHGNLKNLRL